MTTKQCKPEDHEFEFDETRLQVFDDDCYLDPVVCTHCGLKAQEIFVKTRIVDLSGNEIGTF